MKLDKIGLALILAGIILLVFPTVTPSSLMLNDNLVQWTPYSGSVALDSNIYFSSPDSLAWSTNVSNDGYNQLLRYIHDTSDWNSTPILTAEIHLSMALETESLFRTELATNEGGWKVYQMTPVSLAAERWTHISVDLRNASDGTHPDLTQVNSLRFSYYTPSYPPLSYDLTFNLDDVQLLAAGPPSPPPPTYTVTIAPSVNGTTTPASGTYTYDHDQRITLTATADAGYRFKHWLVDEVAYGDNPLTISVTSNLTISAVFELEPPTPPDDQTYTVTILPSTNGATTPTAGTYTHDFGDEITLTATPNDGYYFDVWTINHTLYTNNPQTINVTDNLTISATFNEETADPSNGDGDVSEPDFIKFSGLGCIVAGVAVMYIRRKKT